MNITPANIGLDFNPRHPRGWRHWQCSNGTAYSRFQSTPPSRVATTDLYREAFSIIISILATLAGGDPYVLVLLRPDVAFQSTPPSRVATIHNNIGFQLCYISIHATLAGGDCKNHILYPKYGFLFRQCCQIPTSSFRDKNFYHHNLLLFSGANLPGISCQLTVRTILYHQNSFGFI